MADGTRAPAPIDEDGHLIVSMMGGGSTVDVSALAKELTLQNVLTELTEKPDAGQTVTVHVDNPTPGPLATQPVSGTFWPTTQPVSGPLTDTQLRAAPVPVSGFPATQPVSGTVGVSNMVAQGLTDTQLRASAVPVSGPLTDTQLRAAPIPVSNTALAPSALAVTATAATGVAVTATLPAVAAQFHYVTSIEITLYSTAARTGSATPVVVTTTNLPGALAWTFATAAAVGTTDPKVLTPTTPLRSSVANTATTVVCPAVVGGVWRANVTYYTGA
jgi:hypothetical protein